MRGRMRNCRLRGSSSVGCPSWRGKADVADLSGLKCQPLIEDSPNTSGGLSFEAHLESQSDNSEEPLDWKKAVLDSIANASMVLETDRYLEDDLALKILADFSEEISMLIQSEASLSMNKVVFGVSSTIIKHFVVCIRLLEKRMSHMQNVHRRQNLEINRLKAEIELTKSKNPAGALDLGQLGSLNIS